MLRILTVFATLWLSGCASFQVPADERRFITAWDMAEELGYHPGAAIPQKHRKVVWVPWTERSKIETLCSHAVLDTQRAIGCTIATGYTPNDTCVSWVIDGDWLTYFHEEEHCRGGHFHRKGENYNIVRRW